MRRITLTLLTLALLLMSLHDFYFLALKLPVVPISGAVLYMLVLLASYPPRVVGERLSTMAIAVSIATLVILNTLVVSSNFDTLAVKAPLGYLLGLSVLWATTSRDPDHLGPALAKAVTFVLILHVGAWCVQVAVYYATGVYLDVSGWLSDNASRHETTFYGWSFSGHIQRFTGLFAEPAIYSTAVFMMVTWRLVASQWRPRIVDGLAIATMVCSWSMTGMLLSAGIGAVLLVSRVRVVYKVAASILFGTLCFATVALGRSAYFIERSAGAAHDTSMNGRYVEGWDYLTRQTDLPLLIGRGLGTYDADITHIGRTGSGIMDSLIYLGVFGTAFFVVAFVLLFRIHRVNNLAIVLWGGSLLSGPQQTSVMWWTWAAAIMSISAWAWDRSSTVSPPSPQRTSRPGPILAIPRWNPRP